MMLGRYSLEEWNKIAFNAHLTCFSEFRDPSFNRYDYVLCTFKEDSEKTIATYASIIELDKDTAYMQHGGAFPSVEGTALVVRSYKKIIDHLRARYKRASTKISNYNLKMLKMALSEGFIIIGVDCHVDGTYLHLINEFEKESGN